ncbi:MAG: metal-dependent hydrolase [Planctomycetes bacterium]|nr:metal-dependent hydrolase [Planctomycetota bacterium]
MDTLTHGLVGYLLARSGADARHGPSATAACLVGSVLPDADYALYGWSTEAYMRHHRGWTHCLPGGVVLSLLVGLAASRFGRSKGCLAAHLGLAFAGYLSHAFLDLVTSYGTVLFFPFTDRRYSLDWLFIVDVPFTAACATAVVLVLRRPAAATSAARAGLVVLVAYLALAAGCRLAAQARLDDLVRGEQLVASPCEAIPAAAGPFRWVGYAVTERQVRRFEFLLGAGTVARREYAREVPAGDPAFQSTAGLDVVRAWLWFARYPIRRVRRDGDETLVEYFDVRYDHFEGRWPFVLRIRLDPRGRTLGHVVQNDVW